MKTWKGSLGKNKGIKKEKKKKKVLVVHLKKKKTVGMIGMRFATFSKDSDNLSVTISMEENYQKSGAKCSTGGNLGTK